VADIHIPKLIRADARQIPLADGSVQCIVTSPPFYGLWKYDGAQDGVWDGRLGCEHEWVGGGKVMNRRQAGNEWQHTTVAALNFQERIMSKKKYYVFRPYGEDEGWVALLTEAEADQLQERLNKLEDASGDPPYYLYPMEGTTAKKIAEALDMEAMDIARKERAS